MLSERSLLVQGSLKDILRQPSLRKKQPVQRFDHGSTSCTSRTILSPTLNSFITCLLSF
nr:MAG TPA: hypothetical protein [Caudoviricetes sp.]